ncbi:hypothetical protein ACFFSW_13435 [Saccharothrix longispora]|uniref:Uncharacterized protein n=1 Tax=Saccharothrix longispora TaxID=33920 RepID=A0ABU1PPY7_9PSEU|nr:hypothetical protein [Saccharothrix longispora]MDR6592698.1 hypothetical protein [Saccharothrix longispora]
MARAGSPTGRWWTGRALVEPFGEPTPVVVLGDYPAYFQVEDVVAGDPTRAAR